MLYGLCLLLMLSGGLSARNPFVLPHSAHTVKSVNGLTLEGVVRCNGVQHAVLRCGKQREMVTLHSSFAGYRVIDIKKSSVVLEKDAMVQRLTLE